MTPSPLCPPVWMWLGSLPQGTIFIAVSHLAMDSSHGAGGLGRVYSCLSHCSAAKALCSEKVVQLLGLLTPIFPVIWGAKCYLQASWTVTLFWSDKPHARTELLPKLFIRGKQITSCYQQHYVLQKCSLMWGFLTFCRCYTKPCFILFINN